MRSIEEAVEILTERKNVMEYVTDNDDWAFDMAIASLFDGIGGFPLVFSLCGCKPVWASEVEDFCIAVTKKRFKEE